MKESTQKYLKPWLIVGIVLIVIVLALAWAIFNMPPPPPASPPDFPFIFTLKTILTSVNAALLIILLIIYVDIYRVTRSKFTLGLVIFSLALLLQVLSSHPLLHQLFGVRGASLGPFFMIPDFFTLIAAVMLLNLTDK
ncbi:MAG: hypothetical protein ACFFCH_02985 [Promethearchaeota archaeon]